MRNPAKTSFLAALALVLPAAFLPQVGSAQVEEEPEEPLVCTAQTEVTVAPGQSAVSVTFTLSEDIGPILGVESSESGLLVADPADLPRVDMANPEATPQPIQISNEAENTVIVWLNSADAQEGTHEFWLVSEGARCASTITVEDGTL